MLVPAIFTGTCIFFIFQRQYVLQLLCILVIILHVVVVVMVKQIAAYMYLAGSDALHAELDTEYIYPACMYAQQGYAFGRISRIGLCLYVCIMCV